MLFRVGYLRDQDETISNLVIASQDRFWESAEPPPNYSLNGTAGAGFEYSEVPGPAAR